LEPETTGEARVAPRSWAKGGWDKVIRLVRRDSSSSRPGLSRLPGARLAHGPSYIAKGTGHDEASDSTWWGGDPPILTLPVGIASFQSEYNSFPGIIMAGALIAAVPVLAVFTALQRFIVQSVASAGLKG
jgi:hypothetical protein